MVVEVCPPPWRDLGLHENLLWTHIIEEREEPVIRVAGQPRLKLVLRFVPQTLQVSSEKEQGTTCITAAIDLD
jgi:hypothetical protein